MSIDARMAWRNIWRNPRRTVLTVAAIAFACLVLVFMVSFQVGAYRAMIDSAVQIHVSHLQVQAEGFRETMMMRRVVKDPGAVIEVADSIGLIKAHSLRSRTFSLVSSEDWTYGALVTGVDPEGEAALSTLEDLVREGEYLSADDPNGVLLGYLLAEKLHARIGSELTVLGQGLDGSIAAALVTVRGIVSSGVDELDRSTVHLPLATFQEVYSMGDAVHEVAFLADDLWKVPEIKQALTAALPAEQGRYRLVALDWDQLMPGLKQAIELDAAGASLFYIGLIIVVAFSILNTFLMAFLERTREFGVLKALGATPGRLGRLMLLESMLLTSVGVAIGIVLGGGLVLWTGAYGIDLSGYSEVMNQFGISGRVYPRLSALTALAGPVAVLVITSLAAIYPALKIRSLRPVEAISHV